MIEVYDSTHAIKSQDYSPGALNAFDLTLTRDSLQRIATRTSPRSGFTWRQFRYDAAGRLTNACDYTSNPSSCQNVVNQTTTDSAWTYDQDGNRSQLGTAATYGAGNRTQSYGGSIFAYDSTGNVTCNAPSCSSGTSGWKYTWDALGRLTEVRRPNGALVAAFAYAPDGRRVRHRLADSSRTELYFYDGNQVVLDVDSTSGTVLNEYGWLPGTDRLFAAHLGGTNPVNAVALTDPQTGTVRGLAQYSNGALVKQYLELPWGDVAADTGKKFRFRFAGRELDQETGLYYMRARYYDPGMGRWISEDPAGLDGGENFYGYAGDDPVNRRDPSGSDYECYIEPLQYDSTSADGAVRYWTRWVDCFDVPSGAVGPMVGTSVGGGSGTGQAAGRDDAGNRAGVQGPDCGALALETLGNAAIDLVGAHYLARAGRLLDEGGRLFERAGQGQGLWQEVDRAVGRGMWWGARDAKAAAGRVEATHNVGLTAIVGLHLTAAQALNTVKDVAGFFGPWGAVVAAGIGLAQTAACYAGTNID